ncbi:MAG: 2-hydroxyhepta-2,4-diene-1,7-dioate isomerase [Nitrosomonadaceae bacterium]|nr:2-hydroxyhepta-2,4-diene-1,7-dioate isomerase [Nitrosomonadaceae bacterium]|tara:strand:+ start:29 stop:796 length:768 start_codon:yes stop_codon:yes gene_type:complete
MKIVRFQIGLEYHYGDLLDGQVFCWSAAPWEGGKRLTKSFPADEITLMAPCKPRKIVGVAINYPGATGLKEGTNEPLVFLKPSSSVIGSGQSIISPFKNISVWGECELGIVIGKRLQQASLAEVEEGIFGYTIGNDVTADNIEGWDHHLVRSKGVDTFCPLGPWIDTEFKPHENIISGYHNTELLRKGYLHERLFKEPELLVWLSSWMTLEPGDIVLTGAPTRVRERIYFKDKDNFTCSIEGLGELSNSFKSLHD